MFIPFITSAVPPKGVYRRKGGGGGGGGFGGSKGSSIGKGKSSSGGGGGGGSGGKTSKSFTISCFGTPKSSSSYGGGGGAPVAIPAGQIFAGRVAGGGTRGQIYGTRTYGSGYPGVAGHGVAGRGFPFYFWPIAWGASAGPGMGPSYLYGDEYGLPSNTTRPGGAMVTAAFQSGSSANTTVFRVVADNTTVTDLITNLRSNCSASLSSSGPSTPSPFSDSPRPEQVIQYYRASSIALSLDGYNNTAASETEEGGPYTPLPGNVDTALMDCLNQTIAQAAPLIDGAGGRRTMPHLGLLGLVWLVYCILGSI